MSILSIRLKNTEILLFVRKDYKLKGFFLLSGTEKRPCIIMSFWQKFGHKQSTRYFIMLLLELPSLQDIEQKAGAA